MKILLTSDWYTFAVNGVVTSILNLRKGLEARGHEVRILTLSQTRNSYMEDGVTYIGSLSAGNVYPGARIKLAFSRKEIDELLEWKPDIVHSNCEFSTFLPARKIAAHLDIPLIHTYHTVYENYTHYISPNKKWGRGVVKILTRRIASQTDALIAPTEKVKRILEGYNVIKPIYIIPTGIERERFLPRNKEREAVREKLGIPNGYTVLISVGRLAKEKNCEELLQAISKFRQERVMLLFVGDGPCRGELEEQVRQLDLKNQVIFTGMVPPKEVGSYYHAGDLFVSASSSETQGLTYLEAISASLPLLCRQDTCLNGVLLNGVNGWQYKTREEFSERLKLFLDDHEIRKRMSCEAIRISEQFSVSSFAENAETVYLEQIMQRHSINREESA